MITYAHSDTQFNLQTPPIIAVAPMIDWTDRFCRYFLRLLSKHVWLYTEMITTGALLHGDAHRHLRFDISENPIALQLGGSDPAELANCARMGEDAGYDAINLNVGCPSDRVQSGKFGACLMAEPTLVAECISAMRNVVKIPVTVKTRITLDDQEPDALLWPLTQSLSEAGCAHLIVHARSAWLKGLNPKENRTIPPLRYDIAEKLKQDFPKMHITLNGGIQTLEEIETHLKIFDGVMLGRAAYNNPYLLATIDQQFFGATYPIITRSEILEALIPFVETQQKESTRVWSTTRHILGLTQGLPGARAFRKLLSDPKYRDDVQVLKMALNM